MILTCVGTRPEWIKIKPLISHINTKILYTGQHISMLPDIKFDMALYIDNKRNRLNSIISSILDQFPDTSDYKYVLVQGDTATAYACALAAFNAGTDVIHLEAGLRTYNLGSPFPEEGYRQMISRIAKINLCPTKKAANNLWMERINNYYVVGNTVLDNIVNIKPTYGNTILVTLHRTETIPIIDSWFYEINCLAKENKHLKFVLPIHANPKIKIHSKLLTDVTVVDPLDHDSLINIMKDTLLCITDSGGIQEEATFLNKKTIVCRTSTERSEGIESGHLIMCPTPDKLKETFNLLKNNYKINTPCPFGNGYSSELIAKIICSQQ